jgi:hypothetical protein
VLEWVEAVQQEAPGAVMGVVWTHVDLKVEVEEDVSSRRTCPWREVTSPKWAAPRRMWRSPSEEAAEDEVDSDSDQKEGEEEDDEEVKPVTEFDAHQRRVLVHVQVEIERQVLTVHEAMRQAELEFDTDAAWSEKRAKRDAELEALDWGVAAWQETGARGARSRRSAMRSWRRSTGAWLRGRRQVPKSGCIETVADTLASLAKLHLEMQEIEARMFPQGGEQHARDEAKQRLQRLREQRVRQPRILFSCGVSSKTGHGLAELRRALVALMKDQRLFPHVGMRVPLSYAMLERLAQEGRVQAEPEPDAPGPMMHLAPVLPAPGLMDPSGSLLKRQDPSGPPLKRRSAKALCVGGHRDVACDEAPRRAVWEDIVTSHVDATATAGLRAVCAQPYVQLRDLEREAGKVGVDKGQLHRALQFLHATGSVLHYGAGTRQHSRQLQQVVFMQPQFIIDLIKYVIRESRGRMSTTSCGPWTRGSGKRRLGMILTGCLKGENCRELCSRSCGPNSKFTTKLSCWS